MMPLTFAAVGEENMIKKSRRQSRNKEVPGESGVRGRRSVTVISQIGGNVIVNVKESRVAVSKEMASKIMV